MALATSITPVGALPECPHRMQDIFNFITGGDPVRWFNSTLGLTTNNNYLASTTLELAPTDSNSNSVEQFSTRFSGNIIISAEPVPCPGDRVNYVINVPEASDQSYIWF